MRLCQYLLLAIPSTLALAGCSHPKAADDIAKNGGLYNKFVPAARTTVVGQVYYPELDIAIASVDLSHAPFPQGTFLVTRDAQQQPTAVLQATRQVSFTGQGMMIVSGTPKRGEEVVEPGPELARLVQDNINTYLVAHPAPAPSPAPAAASAPAGTTPAVTLTPISPSATAK